MESDKIVTHLRQQIKIARKARLDRRPSYCWEILEEAHIISQPFAWMHSLVHWQMLLLAINQIDWLEVRGQLVRLFLAAPGSLLKRYPLGNTGRSNVSMFLPMPIPKRISEKIALLARAEQNNH
jgi:hypothetical protein